MKLLFASDLHGSLSATEKVLEQFENSNAEWLILLGDLLNHGPRNALPDSYAPAEVAELLNTYASKIIAVQGNCDSEVDQMLLHFPLLSFWQQILLPKKRIFFTHGHHYSPYKMPPLNKGDVFIYGHTHIIQAEKIDGIYCINPGSISIPKGGNPPSYAFLDNDLFSVYELSDKKHVLAQIQI